MALFFAKMCIVVLQDEYAQLLYGPGGERIVDAFQKGRSSNLTDGELGKLHMLAIIPTSSVLELLCINSE